MYNEFTRRMSNFELCCIRYFLEGSRGRFRVRLCCVPYRSELGFFPPPSEQSKIIIKSIQLENKTNSSNKGFYSKKKKKCTDCLNINNTPFLNNSCFDFLSNPKCLTCQDLLNQCMSLGWAIHLSNQRQTGNVWEKPFKTCKIDYFCYTSVVRVICALL